MANSFTVFWSADRYKLISQYHLEGSLLDTLFGGPHTSEPSFRRAGVKEGDTLYPVRVSKGVIYILGRMRVKEIISIEEYIERFPDIFRGVEASPWVSIYFDNYINLHPEIRYLAPTCTEEAVLGYDGTPIPVNVPVPPEMLESLRFRSQRRERGLKHVENGKLKNVISLQGIYRLSDKSGEEFANLLAGYLK